MALRVPFLRDLEIQWPLTKPPPIVIYQGTRMKGAVRVLTVGDAIGVAMEEICTQCLILSSDKP